MGYLNNSVVTIDAILTDTGRQLLAQNNGQFRITQFALADDEIDYTLYNPNNPSGSAFYGQAATISDIRLFSTFEGVGIDTPAVQALNLANTTQTLGTSVSRTVVGTTINLRATTINTLFGSNTQLQATLTVEGRDSGARLTIPVTVTKVS
jgi:hypothetical protein